MPVYQETVSSIVPQEESAHPDGTRKKAILLLALLVLANIVLWLLTWKESHRFALLLSTGLLAYGFGLRHAVDADHIAAIDNTTRKLLQDGQKPIGVGFFFSLGHSTVVILLCAGLALATAYVHKHLPQWQAFGGVAGTIISGVFLYAIGFINLVVLWDLYKAFRQVVRGDGYSEQHVDEMLAQRGLLGRIFRPILRLIGRSWQMYLVGFLFGLGFDTASEVGVLALAANSGRTGMPFWAIMLLPLLFTVGMCLIDTLDGILMLNAYGWAFIKPVRKLYYNLSITTLSVLVAFIVGTFELLQIIQQQFRLSGPFWHSVAHVSFDSLGYIIVGMFVLGWGLSMLIYRLKKYETMTV